MNHEQKQARFYRHLRMHPKAHKAAVAFAKKIVAKDPAAIALLKELAAKSGTDESAANALRIIAVTVKYEFPDADANIMAGGIASAGGKVLKLALSPIAWTVSTAGHAFKWAGSQLQHLSHAV